MLRYTVILSRSLFNKAEEALQGETEMSGPYKGSVFFLLLMNIYEAGGILMK